MRLIIRSGLLKVTSVSYTHLDVYKRQETYNMDGLTEGSQVNIYYGFRLIPVNIYGAV